MVLAVKPQLWRAVAAEVSPLLAPDAVVVDSGISLFPAEALLSTMHESGYAGPAIVIEDPESPFDPALVPASLPLQRLPRPLDMHRLFEAVAAALAGRRAD